MRSIACALVIAVPCACTIDGSIGRVDTGGVTEASDDAAGTTAAGASTVDTEADDAGDGSGSAGGSGDGGGTHGSDASDTTGDPPVPSACEPHEGDSACVQCRKLHCCDELHACVGDPACLCMWQCLAEPGHTEPQCAKVCAYDGSAHGDLFTCATEHCADTCLHPSDEPPP